MPVKKQIIATTRRLRRASPTSRSIIEQNPALDHHTFAGSKAMRDDRLIALLESDFHRARLEGPGFDLDEYLIGLVAQYQSRCRHHRYRSRRRHELRIGKHVRLEPHV